MSITDQTYFQKRLISIPALNNEFNLSQLNDYIELMENDYLDSVLGYQMRKEFLLGIGDAGKWDNLLNGSEYTDCDGNLQKWIGFNNSIKESPIAYYIYFHKVREGDIILSTTGNIRTKNENSDRLLGYVNLVMAYNYMVRYNRSLAAYIEANENEYLSYEPNNKLTDTINIYGI